MNVEEQGLTEKLLLERAVSFSQFIVSVWKCSGISEVAGNPEIPAIS